jgi:hypothetical protein
MPASKTKPVLEWSDPPPLMKGRSGSLNYLALRDSLAERRGQWAKVVEVTKRNAASSRVSALRRNGMEAVSRRIADDEFGVWARVA